MWLRFHADLIFYFIDPVPLVNLKREGEAHFDKLLQILAAFSGLLLSVVFEDHSLFVILGRLYLDYLLQINYTDRFKLGRALRASL